MNTKLISANKKRLFVHALKPYIQLIIFLSLCFLIFLTPLNEQFRYTRSLVDDGHYWLLIAGHFTHLSWSHLFFNLAFTGIIWVAFLQELSHRLVSLLIIFLSFYIGICIHIFNLEVNDFLGLSAVSHGLVIAGAVLTFNKTSAVFNSVVIFCVLAKHAHEDFYANQAPAVIERSYVLTDGHQYGIIGAGIFCFSYFALKAAGLVKNTNS